MNGLIFFSNIQWTGAVDGQVSTVENGNENHNLRNMDNGETLYVRPFYQFSLIFRHHSGFREVEEKYIPLPRPIYLLFIYCLLYSAFSIVQCSNALYRL